jgi:putative component of membrane protein insertase Oxa1/YidC/SpoIIIJ protein YidD
MKYKIKQLKDTNKLKLMYKILIRLYKCVAFLYCSYLRQPFQINKNSALIQITQCSLYDKYID